MMEKLKVYQIATAVLLLLNLGLLAFLFLSPGPRGRLGGNAMRQLEMTDKQNDQFLALARAHQEKMKSLNEQQRQLLEGYFSMLSNPDVDSSAAPPDEVTRIEEEKIISTYQHFLEVKKMLTPEQMGKYPVFVETTTRRILGGNEKRPLPPKERK